jgi:hypothetical protein
MMAGRGQFEVAEDGGEVDGFPAIAADVFAQRLHGY